MNKQTNQQTNEQTNKLRYRSPKPLATEFDSVRSASLPSAFVHSQSVSQSVSQSNQRRTLSVHRRRRRRCGRRCGRRRVVHCLLFVLGRSFDDRPTSLEWNGGAGVHKVYELARIGKFAIACCVVCLLSWLVCCLDIAVFDLRRQGVVCSASLSVCRCACPVCWSANRRRRRRRRRYCCANERGCGTKLLDKEHATNL